MSKPAEIYMTATEFTRCRVKARIMQRDLVPILGRNQGTISGYEMGKHPIPRGVANVMRVIAGDPDRMLAAFRKAAGLDPETGEDGDG